MILERIHASVAIAKQQAYTCVLFIMNRFRPRESAECFPRLPEARIQLLAPGKKKTKKQITDYFDLGTVKFLPKNDIGVRPCNMLANSTTIKMNFRHRGSKQNNLLFSYIKIHENLRTFLISG